jgi:V-type H+-transporting ATPase subunit B
LRIFPKELLNRISPKIIEEFYSRKPSGTTRGKSQADDAAKKTDKLVDDN